MYKIKYRRRFEFLVLLLFVFSIVFAPVSNALEIVVSDNGSDSSNEVSVQVENETTVTQANEADVENTVIEDLNTGENTADGNTQGDVSIQTGDASSTTSINNELNNSYVETECCPSTTDVTITGNGENSDNAVDLGQEVKKNISVDNIANITNSVSGNANTGDNKASNNTGGNVGITTGNINVQNGIVNNPVNFSSVKASAGFSDTNAAISNNGSESENAVNTQFFDKTSVCINHTSDIENILSWDANTGGNKVYGNSGGDVNVTTGDIDIVNFIENFVNIGGVEIECCEDIYDPGDDGEDEEGNGGEGGVPGDDGGDNGSDPGSSSGGSILPSAAATEAGGPGIIGLSDTSSDSAKTLFFWLSLGFIAFGGKIVTEELLSKTSDKNTVK